MIRDYGWLAAAIVIGVALEVFGVGETGSFVAIMAAIRLVDTERRIRRLERER